MKKMERFTAFEEFHLQYFLLSIHIQTTCLHIQP
jgi:hypothetical protein